MPVPKHPEYLHHQNPGLGAVIREAVFGLEDGMVSTVGAVLGMATATGDHFTAVLSGFVIVAVESISMAVGSYLSTKSEIAVDERKLREEQTELEQYPEEEREELREMYEKDDWPAGLAASMAEAASRDQKLFLREMAYRELKIIPEDAGKPITNALVMGASYVIGGAIPVAPYLAAPVEIAIPASLIVTLIGLFVLGVWTTKYSHRSWWRAGMEMLVLASAAATIGYAVGQAVDRLWLAR